MNTIHDGGPAFPSEEPSFVARDDVLGYSPGMTLRDYFAAHCSDLGDEASVVLAAKLAATQGVAKPADNEDMMGWHRFWCAAHAAHRYMMADAMLAARNQQGQQP